MCSIGLYIVNWNRYTRNIKFSNKSQNQKEWKNSLQHTASDASLAALNRLDRCWFILALGATPSIQFKTEKSIKRHQQPKKNHENKQPENKDRRQTNSHKEKLPRPHHVKQPINVIKHALKHLLKRGRGWLQSNNTKSFTFLQIQEQH
jgi:hypothetical protein